MVRVGLLLLLYLSASVQLVTANTLEEESEEGSSEEEEEVEQNKNSLAAIGGEERENYKGSLAAIGEEDIGQMGAFPKLTIATIEDDVAPPAPPPLFVPKKDYPDTLEGKVEALLDWNEAAGGFVHNNLEFQKIENRGIGLMATGEVKAGETIMKVAPSCHLFGSNVLTRQYSDRYMINASTMQNEPIFDGVKDDLKDENHDKITHILLYFALLREYDKGSESYWWPYLQLLPNSRILTYSPLYWTTEERAEINKHHPKLFRDLVGVTDASLAALLEWQAKICAHAPADMTKSECDPELFKWAYVIGRTRSWAVGWAGAVLVPLADLLNHRDDGPHLASLASPEDGSTTSTFTAPRNYTAGTEFFDNYGLKEPATLLIGFGFAPLDASIMSVGMPSFAAFIPPAPCQTHGMSSPLCLFPAASKARWQLIKSMNCHVVGRMYFQLHEPLPNFFHCLRVYNLGLHDLGHKKILSHQLNSPFSAANERAALQQLQAIVHQEVQVSVYADDYLHQLASNVSSVRSLGNLRYVTEKFLRQLLVHVSGRLDALDLLPPDASFIQQ